MLITFSASQLELHLKSHIKKLSNSRMLNNYKKYCDQYELTDEWLKKVSQAFQKKEITFLAKHFVTSEMWLRLSKEGICSFANSLGYSVNERRVTGNEMKKVIHYLTGLTYEEIDLNTEVQRVISRMRRFANQISTEKESAMDVIAYVEKSFPEKIVSDEISLEFNAKGLLFIKCADWESSVISKRYTSVAGQMVRLKKIRYRLRSLESVQKMSA